MRSDRFRRRAGLAAAVLWLCAAAPAARADGEVRVTVIAILASTKHNDIDPKLKCLADQMRQQEPALTGFRTELSASTIRWTTYSGIDELI